MIRKTKTRLSTKAQIVLPKVDASAPSIDWNQEISLKSEIVAKVRTWESIVGCVRYAGPRRSINEMDNAVAAEARSRK
jgi:hypothetical protein